MSDFDPAEGRRLVARFGAPFAAKDLADWLFIHHESLILAAEEAERLRAVVRAADSTIQAAKSLLPKLPYWDSNGHTPRALPDFHGFAETFDAARGKVKL